MWKEVVWVNLRYSLDFALTDLGKLRKKGNVHVFRRVRANIVAVEK
jgi:hypothetical protein